MSDKRIFVLAHPQARGSALECVRQAPDGYVVTVQPPKRSLEQNARMWAMLQEVSERVIWHGRKLDAQSWKAVFTASLKKMDVVPNLEGTGFVALGQHTSKMTKRELSDLIELMAAFMVERGVDPETGEILS